MSPEEAATLRVGDRILTDAYQCGGPSATVVALFDPKARGYMGDATRYGSGGVGIQLDGFSYEADDWHVAHPSILRRAFAGPRTPERVVKWLTSMADGIRGA